jgi:hypothetical protein
MSLPVGERRRGAFTEREIELVLLRRMADLQMPLVEQALRRLDSSRTEMREANRRWNAVAFGRPGPLRRSRFVRALGAPAVDRAPVPDRPAGPGEGQLLRSCWPLSLWPGFWLQVLADASEVVWHSGLVRSGGSAPAVLRTVADALPWTCTLPECAAAFTDVTFHDVGLSGHEAVTCTAPGPDGRTGRWLLRSVWGLLQVVEPSRPSQARKVPRGVQHAGGGAAVTTDGVSYGVRIASSTDQQAEVE